MSFMRYGDNVQPNVEAIPTGSLALDLRGMRIASRWYSSFILTRPMEEEERRRKAALELMDGLFDE